MMNDNLTPVCLDTLGFDKRYVLFPQGYVLNTKTNNKLKGHKYSLRRLDGSYQSIALRTLYNACYNKLFVTDEIENLPNEEWLPIVVDKPVNTDISQYFISSKGRIKSYKYYKAAILEQELDIYGYYTIKIGETHFKVHRLVALAFIPNNDKTKDTVDHKNGIKTDNRVSNLQWLSRLDNIKKEWKDRKQEKELIQSELLTSL